MADNSTLPGTGDVVAADEISSVKFQRMKADPRRGRRERR